MVHGRGVTDRLTDILRTPSQVLSVSISPISPIPRYWLAGSPRHSGWILHIAAYSKEGAHIGEGRIQASQHPMYAGSYKGVSWGVEEGDGQIIERGGDMERAQFRSISLSSMYSASTFFIALLRHEVQRRGKRTLS